MYRIRKSIDIDFSHQIRGHQGPCINLHGHTWKFEVEIEAEALNPEGFVVDFKDLKTQVLLPCHALLDHALAIGQETFDEVGGSLASVGEKLLAQRSVPLPTPGSAAIDNLQGAHNQYPGGMKVAVFPFSPTSERLARWLYELACSRLNRDGIRVVLGRVYETLHPVESVAEYFE